MNYWQVELYNKLVNVESVKLLTMFSHAGDKNKSSLTLHSTQVRKLGHLLIGLRKLGHLLIASTMSMLFCSEDHPAIISPSSLWTGTGWIVDCSWKGWEQNPIESNGNVVGVGPWKHLRSSFFYSLSSFFFFAPSLTWEPNHRISCNDQWMCPWNDHPPMPSLFPSNKNI